MQYVKKLHERDTSKVASRGVPGPPKLKTIPVMNQPFGRQRNTFSLSSGIAKSRARWLSKIIAPRRHSASFSMPSIL